MNFDNCYHTIAKQIDLTLSGKGFDVLNIHFGITGVVTFENHKIILNTTPNNKKLLVVLYFDAEPMNESMLKEASNKISKFMAGLSRQGKQYEESHYIVATSDSNCNHIKDYLDNFKQYQIKNRNISDINTWYYFLHGFIALDWFREYKFYSIDSIINNKKFDYNYITMNRLVDGVRNYRLCLMSRLEERGLTDKALVSYSPYTNDNSLPPDELNRVLTYCTTAKRFDLQGDIIPNDSMHINVDGHLRSFLHVVTETCYYQDFNHLTEKIFKPIVMMQPFVLASTKGGLKYLKSYGFKTFSKWIDESYDDIEDPYGRLDAITEEIEKICALTKDEQRVMYNEMLPILIHNRNHFYGDFYNVLHKEMWNNFSSVLSQT